MRAEKARSVQASTHISTFCTWSRKKSAASTELRCGHGELGVEDTSHFSFFPLCFTGLVARAFAACDPYEPLHSRDVS